MSSAHRPTWDPAKGRADERHKSARLSSREMPSHTKLKFRAPPPQKISRDEDGSIGASEAGDTLSNDIPAASTSNSHVSVKEKSGLERQSGDFASSTSSASSSSDSDEESGVDSDDDDETAALMRELEKIKRERAEEKERIERERAEMAQSTREEEIALGNPLLNLENALRGGGGREASESVASSQASYGVKRRWDDDSVFKNQAAGGSKDGASKGFVNDLTRSEFHKRFMQRYVQ